MIKRLALLSLVLFAAASCGNRNRAVVDDDGIFDVKDSLVLRKDMGNVMEKVYTGTIPAADTPGIEYTLTLYRQEYSSVGVYELQKTYIGAEYNQARTFTTYGRYETGQSSSYDILYLRPFESGDEDEAFHIVGVHELHMLDRELNPIESGHNYILRSDSDF